MSNTTKRKTIEEVKDFLVKIESESKLISKEYKNNGEPLEFICKCGKIFSRCYSNIQQRKSCQCRKCGTKNGWHNIRRSETYISEVYDTLEKFKFEPLNPIDSIRITDKIYVKNEFGYIGKISISNIQLGKMFSVFSIKLNKENLLFNLNNYCSINKVNTKVLSFIDEDTKSSCMIKIKCLCGCGNEYYTNIGDFTCQNRLFCRECTKSQSINERLIKMELNNLNIKFIEQKRFKDCRSDISNYSLPFDFYLVDKKIIIEVDGEQHFKPTQLNGMTIEKSEINFEKTKHNDSIKNKYCKDNNIYLIRISYNEIKNKKYKEIIQSIID